MLKQFLLGVFLGVFLVPAWAQNPTIDSLKKMLESAATSEQQVDVLNDLTYEYIFTFYDSAAYYHEKALLLSQETDYKAGIANHHNMAGIMSRIAGRYSESLDWHLKALRISEDINYQQGIANNYSNIGLIYSFQNQPNKALDYYQKALQAKEKLNDQVGIASTLNDMADIYEKLGVLKKSIETNLKALKIREKIGEYRGISNSLLNLAGLYVRQKKYPEALEYLEQSLVAAKRAHSQTNVAKARNLMGEIYFEQSRADKALLCFQEAQQICESMNELYELRKAYGGLAKCYEQGQKNDSAYPFLKKYVLLNDSLFNIESNQQIAGLQFQYEIQKRDQELEAQATEARRKNLVIVVISLLGFVMIILAVVLYRSNVQRQKANAQLQHQQNVILQKNEELIRQKEEILLQRNFIEEKNTELTHRNHQIGKSIEAAQTIQLALLPFEHKLQTFLPEHFIIFRPKDVVSGDFYWIEQIGTKTIIVAMDCTGHGVPGAFMSLIGNILIDRVVKLKEILDPAQILTNLHHEIEYSLHQSENTNTEGMDVAVVLLELQDDQTTQVTFSGAHRPMHYCDKVGEIKELKGARRAIGGKQNLNKNFTNQVLFLPKESVIYVGSDGFNDQNNAQREKLGELNFKKLLCQYAALPMSEQKKAFEVFLDDYTKGTEQRDDILLIGIKL